MPRWERAFSQSGFTHQTGARPSPAIVADSWDYGRACREVESHFRGAPRYGEPHTFAGSNA
jgi:hypothetical protein